MKHPKLTLIGLGICAFLTSASALAQSNTATGTGALASITTGTGDSAFGYNALNLLTSGIGNTAVGALTLPLATTPDNNTAIGYGALYANTTGYRNTAVGAGAATAVTTGVWNIALGYRAGNGITTGNDNISIGNFGTSADSGVIRIGTQGTQSSAYVAGVYGATAASGVAVYVNSSGQLGTLTSSARYKEAIKDMDGASDVIHQLRPVAFRYKSEIDSDRIPQFGLVAEEVAKVDPSLVVRDEKNNAYTVRYQAVSAMLLNEFQKQHRTVEAQRAEIESLKEKAARVEALEAKVNALLAQVPSVTK